MDGWPAGELLGFDLETTGVDRFSDVPVSFSLVSVVGCTVVRSLSGLVDPGRPVPAEAAAVHGISGERARDEGMPLADAVALVADAIVAAGCRGVPLVGMRLDFDLTMVEVQAQRLSGHGILARGWCGPALDVAVLDRHYDPQRRGRRTLVDLCAHYGVEVGRLHDATADAVAALEVATTMAAGNEELRRSDVRRLHAAQISWHRSWAAQRDARCAASGLVPADPRDALWPLVPAALPPAA